jgi:hypothetical protein
MCKGFGAGTEPKNVAVDEADMSLYADNEEFDMAKFLKAIADPNHWVVFNLQRRFEALCAMLAIVSAHRQPTGLTILVFGPELEKIAQPVLRQRFTKSPIVPQLFTLDNTGGSVPAGVSPYHMSAGRPRTRTERKHAHAHWARLCASHGRGRAPRSCGAWRAGLMGGDKKAIDAIALSLKRARVVSDAAKQVRIPSVGVDRRVRAAGCVQRTARWGSRPTVGRGRPVRLGGRGAAVCRMGWLPCCAGIEPHEIHRR